MKPLKEVYIDVKRQPDEKLKVPIRQWSAREREREGMGDNSLEDSFVSFHSHTTGAVGERD